MRACPACEGCDHHRVLTESDFVLLRCRHCGLVYLGNPPHTDAHYDKYHEYAARAAADDYDLHSANRGLSELWQINGQRLDWLEQHASHGPLLDVGCGRGFFVRSASKRGFAAQGIDVSAAAVDFARATMQVEASTDSAKDLLAAGRRFRVITMWHVLEHFENPLRELQNIHTLLEPGGMLVLEVPNFNSLAFRLSRQKWRGGNHPLYHRTFFTHHTLPAILKRAGFIRARRIRMNYHLQHRGAWRGALKRALNALALDSFLDYYACK